MPKKIEPIFHSIDSLTNRWKIGLSVGQFRFFDAARFKLKALLEISRKIQYWDAKYLQRIQQWTLKQNFSSDYFYEEPNDPDCLYYFPFYEAMEFENLLSQGKAFLDCFSKAMGSLYSQHSPPNKIDRLISVLSLLPSTKNIDKILKILNISRKKLDGIIIDPMNNPNGKKKSLRDLISHRERTDVRFVLRRTNNRFKLTSNLGCVLNSWKPEIVRFQNFRVTVLSDRVFHECREMLEECFLTELKSRNL